MECDGEFGVPFGWTDADRTATKLLAQRDGQISALRQELRNSISKAQTIQEASLASEKTLRDIIASYEANVSRLNLRISTLSTATSELEQRLADARSRAASLESECCGFRSRILAFESEKNGLLARIVSAEATATEKEAEKQKTILADAVQRCRAEKQRREALEVESSTLRSSVDVHVKSLVGLKDYTVEVESKLSASQAAVLSALEVEKDLRSELRDLETAAEQLKQNVEDLKCVNEAGNAELRWIAEDAQRRNQLLHAEMSSLEARNEHLKDEAQELRNHCAELRDQLAGAFEASATVVESSALVSYLCTSETCGMAFEDILAQTARYGSTCACSEKLKAFRQEHGALLEESGEFELPGDDAVPHPASLLREASSLLPAEPCEQLRGILDLHFLHARKAFGQLANQLSATRTALDAQAQRRLVDGMLTKRLFRVVVDACEHHFTVQCDTAEALINEAHDARNIAATRRASLMRNRA